MPINKIISLECHLSRSMGAVIYYNLNTGKCNYSEFRAGKRYCREGYKRAFYWIGFPHRGLLPEFNRCLEAKEFDKALKLATEDRDYGPGYGLHFMRIILEGILKDPTSPHVKLTVRHEEVWDSHPLSNYPITSVGNPPPVVSDAAPAVSDAVPQVTNIEPIEPAAPRFG